VAGAALWVVSLVLGGYFFGTIPVIHDHLTSIVLLGVGLGVGALVFSGAWRYVNSRKAK
jgi:membrane-associated protein